MSRTFGEEVTRARMGTLLVAEGRTRSGAPRLKITLDRIAGSASGDVRIHEGEVCRIGSHPSNDLVLADPAISRFHCRLTRDGHTWRILDAGSRNGTRVDGLKVLEAEVEREILVAIGDSLLRIAGADGDDEVRPCGAEAFGAIIGASPPMQRMFEVLTRVAASDIDVLVQGESGTGKELVAAEIVQRSARADGPLVVVDCGAISPSLVESELFGHVRGAFTGADRDRPGAFESADGGTVFLDEIGELPLELQPKLLRALEAREVRRVGTSKSRRVDVRVIAATHRDLEREVNRGRFREDLYYRLAKLAVRVPPLRDRREDIPLLVRAMLGTMSPETAATRFDRLFSSAVLADMAGYDWPGNVRELRNFVERSMVLEDAVPLPSVERPAGTSVKTPLDPIVPIDRTVPFRIAKERAIEAFERAYLGPVLEECGGNMSKAARAARMDRMYLHQLAQKHGFRTSPRRGEDAG